MPNKLVLTRMLEDYLQIRKLHWSSVASKSKDLLNETYTAAKNGMSMFSSSIGSLFSSSASAPASQAAQVEHYNNDEKINTDVCKALQKSIDKATTLLDWIEVILDCADQAASAQGRRTNTQKDSLLCSTLHAIRTYIIKQLLENPETWAYQAHLNPLKEKYLKTEEQIFLLQSEGDPPESYLAQQQAFTLNLAALGDERSIFKAKNQAWFTHLEAPPKSTATLKHTRELTYDNPDKSQVNQNKPQVNQNKPWTYHANYYLKHHADRVFEHKQESFEEFVARANRKGKLFADVESINSNSAQDGLDTKDQGSTQESKDSEQRQQGLSSPSSTPPPAPAAGDKRNDAAADAAGAAASPHSSSSRTSPPPAKPSTQKNLMEHPVFAPADQGKKSKSAIKREKKLALAMKPG